MTIAQLITSLSAHQPQNTSPKEHTGETDPFVETTATLTTVKLGRNGNGDMTQGLIRSLQKLQQDPPPNHLTPRQAQADYPFPCLKMLMPPPMDQQLVNSFFVQNWKQITQNTWT